jgi:hypothetical protein
MFAVPPVAAAVNAECRKLLSTPGQAAIRIDGTDQSEALHASGDCAIERLLHQARMQLELPVVHANQLDNRVDSGGRRLLEIPLCSAVLDGSCRCEESLPSSLPLRWSGYAKHTRPQLGVAAHRVVRASSARIRRPSASVNNSCPSRAF